MLDKQCWSYSKIMQLRSGLVHLGKILCTNDKVISLLSYTWTNVMIDSAVKDLNCRFNILLADFSHNNSNTLSKLFNSYCMNVYGCQLWKFNGKHIFTE